MRRPLSAIAARRIHRAELSDRVEVTESKSPLEKPKRDIGRWKLDAIAPGESRDIHLAVSESTAGITLHIPIHVRRGPDPGPTVFVTAAVHGDELNGTGAVRQLIQEETLQLSRGAIILVPVLNLLAFDRHSRYLPDRRDLNRCFPGSASGSLAGRVARTIFDEIVGRSDVGIDLHTASVRRTNFPTVRGDLENHRVRQLAESFGCSVMINNRGPHKSFRREATRAGCPTIVMEGGEVWKVEPGIVETAVRGIKNVLSDLQMIDGLRQPPDYQIVIERTRWVRAELGGFLQFHVSPGEAVTRDQPLATNTTLLGKERSVIAAPFDAIVLGMTTLPAISPGDPVCHLGQLPVGIQPHALTQQRNEYRGLDERVVGDLASNVLIVDPGSSETHQL